MTTFLETTPIVFVVGTARSGTTFVADLLHDEFDYGMGPEASFVPQFARKLWRYGDLQKSANLTRLLSDVCACEMLEIARSVYPPSERFDVTPELLRGSLREATYAEVVRAVFEQVATFQGRSRLGSKYPFYWRCPQLLEQLFSPHARYLWVVRDGRDVALSLMAETWGENSVYACARHWAKSMESLHRFRMANSDGRLLVIRYEDLLADPTDQLVAMNELTDAGLQRSEIERIATSIRSGPLADNFGKWRARLTKDEQRIFEAVAGQWLENMGYEREVHEASTSLFERTLHLAGEYARRARRALD